MAPGYRRRRPTGNAQHAHASSGCARLAGPPRRTARGCSAHRSGRVSGRAQLLDRFGAGGRQALTVERLDDGEVSPYLTEELRAGDKLELRGPIGGYFVWDVPIGGPLFLVGGGSGIVPLMAMIRHRNSCLAAGDREARKKLPARLLYSSRGWDEVIYRDELAALAAKDPTLEVVHTLTRNPPDGWTGFHRRIDRAMLDEVAWPASDNPRVFVCGPTPLVEAVASTLVDLGHQPALVKTERFGPTGGPT